MAAGCSDQILESKLVDAERRAQQAERQLTIIATRATPDDERDYGVEDGGERSRNILAARPRKLT